MNENIELKLKIITESPGCYLMKSEGQIIYVGKAKNLKNRVRSYFHGGHHSIKVQTMVNKVDDFEVILCQSNYEALTLECNLIKKHRPFYNILLKDDKQYPYIKIDRNEPYPQIKLARKKDDSGAEFFGPYLGTSVIKEVTTELAKIFPLRNNKLKFHLKEKKRPCVRYEIGLCMAPCANLCTEEEYNEVVDEVIHFLKGNTNVVEKQLYDKMLHCSENLEYERAAEYRDKIARLNQICTKQLSVQISKISQDIWAIAGNIKDAMAYNINIVDGKIIGGKQYLLSENGGIDFSNIISDLLLQVYNDDLPIPKEILLSIDTDDNESYEKWLSDKSNRKVKLIVPKRGKKKELVDLCIKNANEALAKHDLMEKLHNTRTIGASESLAKVLNLNSVPRRIEGYDISNTQGTYSVGSMVTFINGKASKKSYRRFKIQTVSGSNDFASIAEVIYRRFSKGIDERKELIKTGESYYEGSFSDFPDLILIDGGIQQIEFAKKSLDSLNLDIQIFGLAEKNEEIYIPYRDQPIIIADNDPALHLIQRIRDEAHRFAIEYHRSLRDKAMIKSELLNIPDVGNKRVQVLLKKFKSVSNIKQLSIEELQNTKGITKKAAENIYNYFKNIN